MIIRVGRGITATSGRGAAPRRPRVYRCVVVIARDAAGRRAKACPTPLVCGSWLNGLKCDYPLLECFAGPLDMEVPDARDP